MSPSPTTQFLAKQLSHAEWEGFHFYDLIFPLFVFMMGVSTVFSLTKIIQTEGKAARRQAHRSPQRPAVHPGAHLFRRRNRVRGRNPTDGRAESHRALLFLRRTDFLLFAAQGRSPASPSPCCWAIGRCWPGAVPRRAPQPRRHGSHHQAIELSAMSRSSTWPAPIGCAAPTSRESISTDYLDQKYLPGRNTTAPTIPKAFSAPCRRSSPACWESSPGLLLKNTGVPDMKKVAF